VYFKSFFACKRYYYLDSGDSLRSCGILFPNYKFKLKHLVNKATKICERICIAVSSSFKESNNNFCVIHFKAEHPFTWERNLERDFPFLRSTSFEPYSFLSARNCIGHFITAMSVPMALHLPPPVAVGTVYSVTRHHGLVMSYPSCEQYFVCVNYLLCEIVCI